MTRPGRIILFLLATAGASPAGAQRPMPQEAARFSAALSRGDLRTARAELAPRATIDWTDLGNRRRARFEELGEDVAGCTPGEHSTVARDLEDPQLTDIRQHWFCPGKPDVATRLRARHGRLIALEFGPPIVPAPATPGQVWPERPPEAVARNFLMAAVGGRDEGWASITMVAGMEIVDRASGTMVAFHAIADHVERCGLAAIWRTGPGSVVSRWTCPGGMRHIRFAIANGKVSRVELAGDSS